MTNWSDEFGRVDSRRELVIKNIVPEDEQNEMLLTMRGLQVGIASSENDGRIPVTRSGLEAVETYVRYLEREIYEFLQLHKHETKQERVAKQCNICGGKKYTHELVKGKMQPVKCSTCFGTGVIYLEVKDGQ